MEGPGGEVKGENKSRKRGGNRNRRSNERVRNASWRWEARGVRDLSGNGKGKWEGGRSGLNAEEGRYWEEEGREGEEAVMGWKKRAERKDLEGKLRGNKSRKRGENRNRRSMKEDVPGAWDGKQAEEAEGVGAVMGKEERKKVRRQERIERRRGKVMGEGSKGKEDEVVMGWKKREERKPEEW
jgi:hypothetical protein